MPGLTRIATLFVVWLLGTMAGSAFPQSPPLPPPFQNLAKSPEVHRDRSITFRINAPLAKSVSLNFGEATVGTHAMTRDAAGIWSVTIGPVPPEIYSYRFVVDGLQVLDMANANLRSGTVLDMNVVEVPGLPARFDETQPVPRGTIAIHTYQSKVQNSARTIYVYVPDEYYTSTSKRYPVLYLYHGNGGHEGDWTRDGRAAVIMDNLIAGRLSTPMLIVMPSNSLVASNNVGPENFRPASGPASSADILARELIAEIIPYVEARYRVRSTPESRAIAGLSAGGGTAFPVGLNNLGHFAYVGEFGSGMFGGYGTGASLAPAVAVDAVVPSIFTDAARKKSKLKLLYLACGTEDTRLPYQRQARDALAINGYNPVFMTFEGGHEWTVWRHALRDFAPRLFR